LSPACVFPGTGSASSRWPRGSDLRHVPARPSVEALFHRERRLGRRCRPALRPARRSRPWSATVWCNMGRRRHGDSEDRKPGVVTTFREAPTARIFRTPWGSAPRRLCGRPDGRHCPRGSTAVAVSHRRWCAGPWAIALSAPLRRRSRVCAMDVVHFDSAFDDREIDE
jgi:hypothetical protein